MGLTGAIDTLQPVLYRAITILTFHYLFNLLQLHVLYLIIMNKIYIAKPKDLITPLVPC